MSDLLDLNQKLELRDAAGHTVGIVLTQKAVQDLTAERDRLRDEVGQLRKQLEESQRQVALLEQDWQSMFRLLPREYQVTEEDIKAIQRDPHTFEEILWLFEQHKSS